MIMYSSVRGKPAAFKTGRFVLRGLLLAGAAIALAGCNHVKPETTASIPTDYRLRHPIAIQEKERTMEVLIGTSRGALMAAQRAEVINFASTWHKEATGGILIDVPAGTANQHSAAATLREIQSLFASAGVPARSYAVRKYAPNSPTQMATIRLNYPRIVADAGPCGLWPEDLGPSVTPIYQTNRPYWNLGCAYQRNLAAMVANPADLVQPRGEDGAYSGRRAVVLEKYRKGEATATVYPDANQGKLSDVGK